MPANRSKSTNAPPGHGGRPHTNHQSVFNRSSITNGKHLLPGVHSQSQWARRFYDLVHLYASEQGGDDSLSEARRSLIRRCACLQVELESLEVRFAQGGADAGDLDLYQRASGNLRRLLESIGIDRRARDVTPTLAQYIASKEVEAS